MTMMTHVCDTQMTRLERISIAQTRIVELTPEYDRIVAVFTDAQRQLKHALESFDVGERVHVTCWGQGMRIDHEYTGTVESIDRDTHSTRYSIRDVSGHIWKNVSRYDMDRL